MNAQCGVDTFAVGTYGFSVAFELADNAVGGIEGLVCGVRNTFKEEHEPFFPLALVTDFLQQLVIAGAMGLEIKAET